jgi:outer membrane receptor for ferrienterochelin and colicin
MTLSEYRVLNENKISGQTSFNEKIDRGTTNSYGAASNTWHIQGGSKIGIMYPNTPYKGIGVLTNFSLHDQNSYFGLHTYKGKQQTLYTNFIYQSIIQNTQHNYKIGFNYIIDNYQESLNDSTFNRMELVPGLYGEYTYTNLTALTIVTGARVDFHNLYGMFFTPRIHIKYDLTPKLTARIGIGRGFRRPNAIAENFRVLVSSRQLFFDEEIKPEVAWNGGASMHQIFNLAGREGFIDIEAYRTEFENQLIIDMDNNSHAVHFYNLKGKSFANSFQIEGEYEILKNITIRSAYKLFRVKTTISNQLIEPTMIPLHRFFANLAYTTKKEKWKFDFTAKWTGAQRLPDMSLIASDEISKRYTSSYWQLSTQATRVFKSWEILWWCMLDLF